MKKLLLIAAVVCTSTIAHAQNNLLEARKAILVSKTWKVNSTFINGMFPATFEQSNNIKNANLYPAGDRYKFSSDGTFTIIQAAGGTKMGVWELNQTGQLVFNPGGKSTKFTVIMMDETGFATRTFARLGMCNVTSLYEVNWTPAQ